MSKSTSHSGKKSKRVKTNPEALPIPKLAEQFGVDQRTLRKYLIGTKPAEWRYGVRLFTRAQAEAALKQKQDLNAATTEARARLLASRCRLLEYQISEIDRKYIPVAAVNEWCSRMRADAHATFLPIAAKLGPELIGMTAPEAEALLEKAIHEGLLQMHEKYSK